ncbi:MAG: bifunctional 3-deoxy-7-phosphoheptulonate synthase/chorismate mutase type II [Candidatus Cryptobacteroides sp.]|nr:bifunctional 3-deoxy-7-phosphoheptulonate synthase/chorismate mutase type II [Candidatus Cryptobacteroides sp.]
MAHELDIIPGSEWGFFTLPRPMCIAGPCSAETEEQVMETAKGLHAFGIHVYRAGIWKPRTHPGSFEGVGTPGLKWLRKVKETYGMKVCTEVATEKHVLECIKYGVDVIWIGARTSAIPFLMQEIADALSGTDIPVLVKNPVNPDLDLWIGALERLNRAGIRKLGVIHRGFSTSAPIPYRNDPGWKIAIELRTRYPQLAFFADPSHMAGDRKYLLELSQRAMDLGLDGLMVESHCTPDAAWSDAKQQLTPHDLQNLLESLVIRDNTSDNEAYKEGIDALRTRIDVIDENLLKLLKDRMDVSRRIGQYKKEHNVAILQAGRWEQVLSGMVERGAQLGLSEASIRAIMTAIHDESVRVQNAILES